jgi:predicted nucleotidyltransferase
MEALFTIHAGEYLVGSHIEKEYRDCTVWIPSKRNNKDIDLLVSNDDNSKNISIQVKSSKDYTHDYNNPVHRRNLIGSSFFNLKSAMLYQLKAELIVLVIHSFKLKKYHYIILKPKELSKRLELIHGNKRNFKSYLWITKENNCWEARGLKISEQEAILNNDTNGIDKNRNFSKFVNNWSPFEKKFGL